MWLGTNCEAYARPAHQVELTKDFYIGKTEVTQAEWKAMMDGANPSSNSNHEDDPNNDAHPVTNVSWDDVQIFIGKLNERDAGTGRTWRLPTEAEWEYAARGGVWNHGYVFCGFDNGSLENFNNYMWHVDNSDNKTHPVGGKLPNELGLHDMCGNVSEWVSDWYDYYSSSGEDEKDPTGPDSGLRNNHVVRGGNYTNMGPNMSVTFRPRSMVAINPSGNIGFRLALTAD